MGYVDKIDMLKACYEVDRKSKRIDSQTQLSLKLFRISIALGLVGAEENFNKRGRPSTAAYSTVTYEIR